MSYRGSIIDHARNREILFESKLERSFLFILLASTAIVDLWEQPECVEFFDEDGVGHDHWFDVLAVDRAGIRFAIDVKPLAFVEETGLRTVHRLIRQQHGTSLADRYLIRTEDHAHPDDVHDARMVLFARRLVDPDADDAVGRLTRTFSGWVQIEALVGATGLRPFAAFNAAVRLIGDGKLQVLNNTRISYGAYVARVLA